MDMNDTSVGLVSYYRPEKVELCLKSLVDNANSFNEVIVADNGEITSGKKEVYQEFRDKLNLKVLDLEPTCGVAEARNNLVENMDGDFLLLVDDDMTVPSNIDHLYHVLDEKENLGGIGGGVYEHGEWRISASDLLIEEHLGRRYLIKDIKENLEDKKELVDTELGQKTVYIYDFIQNCGLFRRECLEEGKWDNEYQMDKEHADFFLNHKLNTDWRFALSEEVFFGHYPGGSSFYEEERNSDEKLEGSDKYFKSKWGIDRVVGLNRHYYDERSIVKEIKQNLKSALPRSLILMYRESRLRTS